MSNFLVPGTNSHHTLYGDESTPVDPNRSIARTSNWGAMKTRGGLGFSLWRRKDRVGVFPREMADWSGSSKVAVAIVGEGWRCVALVARAGNDDRRGAKVGHTCGPNCDVTQVHVHDQSCSGPLGSCLSWRSSSVLDRIPNPLHETQFEHRLNHSPPLPCLCPCLRHNICSASSIHSFASASPLISQRTRES